jgi:hypothetical protein
MDKYEIIKEDFGKGTFGQVSLVKHKQSGK